MNHIEQRKQWRERLDSEKEKCNLIYESNHYLNYVMNSLVEDKPIAGTPVEKIMETLMWYEKAYEALKREHEGLRKLVYGEE